MSRRSARPELLSEEIHDYLTAHQSRIVEELVGWLRLRSAAGLPEHAVNLIRSANWLVGALRGTDFPTVEVSPRYDRAVHGLLPRPPSMPETAHAKPGP